MTHTDLFNRRARGHRPAIGLAAGLLLAVSGMAIPAQAEPIPADEVEDTLQELLLDATPGSVIELPEGTFSFNRSLSLTVDGVTLRGAGMDKTILSFKEQVQGAEGLLVTGNNFLLEDIAFEDAVGDAVKITDAENVTIRRVRVEWTNGPSTDNGAYGLYPVQTKNVLMEDNVAIGASDAGIYVGQSDNVVVRNNRAEYNVAGIEIENTTDADVYGNIATNNTGGILVFNMPQLTQEGRRTRVYDNQVENNNIDNFAYPGTAVASVVPGTGIIVNSNDEVEIFGNRIKGNKTGQIMVTSVFLTNYSGLDQADSFDPYPESIFIYDNELENGGTEPGSPELKAIADAVGGTLPDILWDGFVNPEKLVDGVLPEALRICVQNGDAAVLNVDAPNEFAQPRIEPGFHDCSLDKLEPVELKDWTAAE